MQAVLFSGLKTTEPVTPRFWYRPVGDSVKAPELQVGVEVGNGFDLPVGFEVGLWKSVGKEVGEETG